MGVVHQRTLAPIAGGAGSKLCIYAGIVRNWLPLPVAKLVVIIPITLRLRFWFDKNTHRLVPLALLPWLGNIDASTGGEVFFRNLARHQRHVMAQGHIAIYSHIGSDASR
jgi:hypothetical protein